MSLTHSVNARFSVLVRKGIVVVKPQTTVLRQWMDIISFLFDRINFYSIAKEESAC